ncbi:protein tyrosine kinase, partial [Oesophagostomum dentatum]
LQLRVRVPVRARLEERDDSILIVISGWPISPLNLTVESDDGIETQELTDEHAHTFFDGLVVRPDKGQSLFYRRVYSVFALACSTCPVDHPAGNYSFEICSEVNCFRLHNYIEHVGNHMILMRKRTILQRVESRRTSRVTEETLLRLEERSSLSSSDYSGQLIPFIDLGTIQIHEKIGKQQSSLLYLKGAFGEVYCGSWEKTGERSVAIKTIEADEDVEKEAVVLSRLEHPNIVRLYGMTRDGPRLLLVFERMNLGDLRSYLRARAPTTSSYAQFPPALVESELRLIIVSGLCYLSTQQIVHRDLAARNCLVSGESDLRCCLPSKRPPITVKISDFGMSRRLYGQADYYRMQNHCLLPVRWLPPEAINDHRFSTSSDVWALGVTMWEVFSYGELPFAELNNFEMVSYAMAGMRPPKPKSCPAPMYELMQRCWAADPEDRIRPEEVLLDPCLTPTLKEIIGVLPT